MFESYAELTDNNTNIVNTAFSKAAQQFQDITELLQSSETLNQEHGLVEDTLKIQGTELLRLLYQAHLDCRSEEETMQDEVVGSDQVIRTHRRKGVARKMSTLFGSVAIRRISYRSESTNALCPMDMFLNLGSSKYSDGLCRRVAEEASKASFDECVNSIKTTTGGHTPKRQCEEIVAQVAQDFEAYYDNTIELEEENGSNLLVMTTDSKGIVMRTEDLRPATQKAAQQAPKTKARLGPGEKKNRKRMATAASVYSVAPLIRAPEEIMDTNAEKPKRPKVTHKRVWASVERSQDTVISEVIQEAFGRDPECKREWVVVVDGEVNQLNNLENSLAASKGTATIIVDFIHVLEYLWKASYCFNAVGSDEAEQWVQEKALAVLQGKSTDVAAGMRRSATRQNLSQNGRAAVDKCADYLHNNKPYLNYASYLSAGYPIASGVIEGACRHLINDRLGITGARWGLNTAEAVLKLRSLRSSGDFDEYWSYHKARERERNHTDKYAHSAGDLVA